MDVADGGSVTRDPWQCPASGPLGASQSLPRKLGVVETGALADLILVDGYPLENLDLIANPNQRFVVIMKDGRLYKNSIAMQASP